MTSAFICPHGTVREKSSNKNTYLGMLCAYLTLILEYYYKQTHFEIILRILYILIALENRTTLIFQIFIFSKRNFFAEKGTKSALFLRLYYYLKHLGRCVIWFVYFKVVHGGKQTSIIVLGFLNPTFQVYVYVTLCTPEKWHISPLASLSLTPR